MESRENSSFVKNGHDSVLSRGGEWKTPYRLQSVFSLPFQFKANEGFTVDD